MSEMGPEFTPIAPTVESEPIQTPEQPTEPALNLEMTIGGPNYIKNLDPSRLAAEQALEAHMDAATGQNNEAIEPSQTSDTQPEASPEANVPPYDNSLVPTISENGVEGLPVLKAWLDQPTEATGEVKDTPSETDNTAEKTTENEVESAEKKKMSTEDLNTYTEALTYDMTHPENAEYTPEQLKNIEIMEGIQKKYPHAFFEQVSEDGKRFLLVGDNSNCSLRKTESGQRIPFSVILSSEGFTQVGQVEDKYTSLERADLAAMVRQANRNHNDAIQVQDLDGRYIYIFGKRTMDYDEVDLSLLKRLLTEAEQKGIKEEAEAKKPLSTEEILSAL